jgi:hypothetical protein
MWTCVKCGALIEGPYEACLKCSTAKGAMTVHMMPSTPVKPKPRLTYRVFRGTWASWEELFNQASEFANQLGPEKVVSISHSEDKDDGVVAVWYWTHRESVD